MTDFMFFVYTEILGIDFKDAHDIPWGTNLILWPIIGLILGMLFLKFIVKVDGENDE